MEERLRASSKDISVNPRQHPVTLEKHFKKVRFTPDFFEMFARHGHTLTGESP